MSWRMGIGTRYWPSNSGLWRLVIALCLVLVCASIPTEAVLDPQDVMAIRDLATRLPMDWDPAEAENACIAYGPTSASSHGIICDPTHSYIEKIRIEHYPNGVNSEYYLNMDSLGWFTKLRTFEVYWGYFRGCPPINQLLNISTIRELVFESNFGWRFCDYTKFNFSLQPLTKIFLEGYFFGGFPPSIGQVSTLGELILREFPRNSGAPPLVPGKSIPQSWFGMPSLQNLTVSTFDSLPNFDAWIASLQSLKNISIDGDFVMNFPSIAAKTGLRALSVNMAPTITFPIDFSILTSLEEITYQGGAALPTNLFQSTSVKKLVFYYSASETYADNWNMPNLQDLTLTISSPGPLPQSITNSPLLKRLVLNWCTIRDLPAYLAPLISLTELTITATNFTGNSQMLGLATLPALQVLTWSTIAPNYIYPDSIGSIKTLRSLTVDSFYWHFYLFSSPTGLLPDSVVQLVNLETLIMNRAWFASGSIPSNFGTQLVNLTTFSLQQCAGDIDVSLLTPLNGLPKLESLTISGCVHVIDRLPNLSIWPAIKKVYIGATGLTQFPNFDGATTLESLYFADTQPSRITALPDVSPGGAPALQSLELFNINSTTLPTSWMYLTSLRELIIRYLPGYLGPFPTEWLSMISLEKLAMYEIKFTSFPPFNYPNLRELSLSSLRELRTLPDGFGSGMTALNEIYIYSCPIDRLPDSMTEMTNLTTLTTIFANFSTTPAVLSRLTNLTSLGMSSSGVPSTEPFPDLRNLTKLVSLTISENYNTTIPSWIPKLPMLKTLYLARNNLYGSIDSRLFSMLEELHAVGNQLNSTLPDDIFDNCTLKYIYLSDNQFFGDVPVSLSKCKKLKELQLDRNNFGPLFPSELLSELEIERLYASGNRFTDFTPPRAPTLNRLWNFWPWPKYVDLSFNQVPYFLTKNMIQTISNYGRQWYLDSSNIECPRYDFVSDWRFGQKTLNPGADFPPDYDAEDEQPVYLEMTISQNHLCLPGSTTALACQSLNFVSNRTRYFDFDPCMSLTWKCGGAQPIRDAPCISPGTWLIPKTLEIKSSAEVYVAGNTTITGNLTVTSSGTLKVQSGALIQVGGCVSVQGRLGLNISDVVRPTATNSTVVPMILFDGEESGFCNNSTGTEFSTVQVVAGAQECEIVSAIDQPGENGIAVVFTFGRDNACYYRGLIAGVVVGFVVVSVIVALVLLYKFRDRVIPAYKASMQLRRFTSEKRDMM